jgi:hypothetical protein
MQRKYGTARSPDLYWGDLVVTMVADKVVYKCRIVMGNIPPSLAKN